MSSFFSCKDCTERHVGCHSTCEKYIAEKTENDRIKNLLQQHRHKDSSTNSNGTYFSGKTYRKHKNT